MGRFEGVVSEVALASAARTATTNSADFKNYGCAGVIVTLDVTALSLTPSITVSVQHKDVASGKYENLFTSAAVTTSPVTNTYIVYPGVAAAAADVTAVAGFVIGKTWRIAVTHADTDSITYSVGYTLVP